MDADHSPAGPAAEQPARAPHLIVCGLLEEDSRLLFDLIRSPRAGAPSGTQFHDGPALDTVDTAAGQWVSHCAADLLATKAIRQALGEGRDLHFVVVIRDPRELMVLPSPAWPSQPAFGFDHSLHQGDNGVVTLSDPGLLFIDDLLQTACRKGFATQVRREDLLTHPDQVCQQLLRIPVMPRIQALAPEPGSARPVTPVCWTQGEAARRVARQFHLAPALFGMLERLGYQKGPEWHARLLQAAPEGQDVKPGTVVGFYTTGSRYEQEARRLRASVQALGLPIHLVPVAPSGDWLSAVRHKPALLLQLRQQCWGPLLYVDVDAVLHSNPWPYLRGMACDMAVASHRGKNVISGTVLINDTPGAVRLLQAWVADQDQHPAAWDQHCLHNVVYAVGGNDTVNHLRVHHLPPEMCRVFDRKYHERIGNVIEHLQASREMRVEDGTERSRDALARRQLRVREIEATLPGIAPTAQGPDPSPGYAKLSPETRRLRTEALMAEGLSDRARWSDEGNLKQAWSSRAEVVAALIGPVARVLDLGCGRMDLEKALPPGVHYLPSDIVARDERTLVADLNQGELPAADAEVVTLLGVLEYINDPAALMAAMASRWRRLVLTYNAADLDRGRDRRSHGWVNDLTAADVVALAHAAGFRLEAIVPFEGRQRIFDFTRVPA